jgi:uncharacterized membrane protein YsdA (DUF1294 family)
VPVNGWLLLAAYNVFVFLVYAWDKRKARHHQWRVPEANLLWLSAFMGGAGALAGIFVAHHKCRKPKFTWSVPVLAMAQAALLWWGHGRGWW